jgi:hypothetical protein
MQASHVALEAGILEAGSPVPARLNARDRQPK